jgi:hypothetical protein
MSNSTSKRRKVLIPLASLLAAGAIAVGSGASFVSTSSNAGNAFTTGTLTQTNSVTGALFNLGNLKPGDSISKDVVIKNSGTLPATFKLGGTATNNFADPSLLTLTVTEGAKSVVAKTTLANLASVSLPSSSAATPLVAAWNPGESHTYTFTVALDVTAGNLNQGKTASAAYTWDAIQENGKAFSGTVSSANTAAGTDNGTVVPSP